MEVHEMYEKKLDLGDVCYILKVELILKSEIISSVLKFPEYCVELSLDSVNWVTVAGLPLDDAGNIDIVQGICIPINAKARYLLTACLA